MIIPPELFSPDRSTMSDAYGALMLEAERTLFHADGRRRLPGCEEVSRLLTRGALLSDLLRGERQLYFLPTVEWITGMIRLFRHLGARSVVEVGSGDGFAASCFEDYGFPVRATDIGEGYAITYGATVERLNHLEAMEAYRPDLVFWCWPPQGSRAPQDIVGHSAVRYYLDVGDGGNVSGHKDTFTRHRCRYLTWLSSRAFSWIDVDSFRHNRNFLFFGRAHERFNGTLTTDKPGG